MLAVNALVIIYVLISTFILLVSHFKQKKQIIAYTCPTSKGLSMNPNVAEKLLKSEGKPWDRDKNEKLQKQILFYLFINCLIALWELYPLLKQINSDFLKILYDWSPLLFLPLLHKETEILTTAFHNVYYDDVLIRFEKKYFSSVMSFHYNNRASSILLSEFLHLCYLSFFLMLYAVPLFFYLKQQMTQFYECEFIILLVLFSCYTTHSVVPACGPRNIFEKIKDHRSHGFLFRVTHKILQDGSTPGTAFPSGHTGVSSAVLLMSWHLNPSLFYCIFPFGIGLIISTIYGRFHYIVDMIFGFLYALLAFFITVSFVHDIF